jgi:hypothetical protein
MSELYTTAALHRMVRYDARREILNAVGDLSNIELFGTNLIVAPYVHSGLLRSPAEAPEVLSLDALYERYEAKTGLLTAKLSIESIYQGKVYLVLAVGADLQIPPDRYDDENEAQYAARRERWERRRLKPGDWIATLQENTRAVSISAPGAKQSKMLEYLGITYVGYPCKFLYDADVYMRINDPDMVA